MAGIEQGNWPVIPGDATTTQPFRLYTTRYGDSLSALADIFLHDQQRWPEIYALNKDRLKSPHELEIGMQLRIPVQRQKVARPAAQECHKEPQQGANPADQLCVKTYTVHKGESLSRIADKLWHDDSRWVELYRANLAKIPDPETVATGTVLTVPDEEEVKSQRADPLANVGQRRAHHKDIEMLARAILAEARGESVEVQMALATATVNYATNHAQSIPGLVRSSYLSSNFDCNKKYYTQPIAAMDPGEWKRAVAAAEDAFKANSRGRQLIGDRDHFYDDSISMPDWGKQSTRIKIGAMYFLNER